MHAIRLNNLAPKLSSRNSSCGGDAVYNSNINNNNHDNVYGAIIVTEVIARVHPVHLINADQAPGGRQPSDQAS